MSDARARRADHQPGGHAGPDDASAPRSPGSSRPSTSAWSLLDRGRGARDATSRRARRPTRAPRRRDPRRGRHRGRGRRARSRAAPWRWRRCRGATPTSSRGRLGWPASLPAVPAAARRGARGRLACATPPWGGSSLDERRRPRLPTNAGRRHRRRHGRVDRGPPARQAARLRERASPWRRPLAAARAGREPPPAGVAPTAPPSVDAIAVLVACGTPYTYLGPRPLDLVPGAGLRRPPRLGRPRRACAPRSSAG